MRLLVKQVPATFSGSVLPSCFENVRHLSHQQGSSVGPFGFRRKCWQAPRTPSSH